MRFRTRLPRRPGVTLGLAALLAVTAGVTACGPAATPLPFGTPGTPDHPRPVIIAAKDYTYIPAVIDLHPGETVTFEVVNGGLVVHEVVLGGMHVQDAWEAAESVPSNLPPGQTPAVSVDPAVGGLRFVVRSGERVDVTFTVPDDAAATPGGWFVGCHIPGHWQAGMVVPVRFVAADGRPLPATPSSTPSSTAP